MMVPMITKNLPVNTRIWNLWAFFALIGIVLLISGCQREAEIQAAPATPYAQQPVAGICAEPPDGDVVEIAIYPDVPVPRCQIVLPNQHLRVINHTDSDVSLELGSFQQTINAGGETVVEAPFGSYLLPGVHRMAVGEIWGVELWLK
jgi:hypothetical protein